MHEITEPPFYKPFVISIQETHVVVYASTEQPGVSELLGGTPRRAANHLKNLYAVNEQLLSPPFTQAENNPVHVVFLWRNADDVCTDIWSLEDAKHEFNHGAACRAEMTFRDLDVDDAFGLGSEATLEVVAAELRLLGRSRHVGDYLWRPRNVEVYSGMDYAPTEEFDRQGLALSEGERVASRTGYSTTLFAFERGGLKQGESLENFLATFPIILETPYPIGGNLCIVSAPSTESAEAEKLLSESLQDGWYAASYTTSRYRGNVVANVKPFFNDDVQTAPTFAIVLPRCSVVIDASNLSGAPYGAAPPAMYEKWREYASAKPGMKYEDSDLLGWIHDVESCRAAVEYLMHSPEAAAELSLI